MNTDPISSKIVVMGAGAVGSFFGGMLARAGHDVTLIARPQHVESINTSGLYMECLTFQEHVRIHATSSLDAVSQADLILFCVKSPDTEKTIQSLVPYLKSDAVILSLQNGVDNCERIRKAVQHPVYPAVVYVATTMAGPGHLKHNGRGELVIGGWEPDSGRLSEDSARLEWISKLFEGSGVPCPTSENVRKEQWFKFLVNCSYNAISAIGQAPYGEMVKIDAIKELIQQLADEVLMVAAKEGIHITHDEAYSANALIARTMVMQHSSTAQDIARNKKTEIDYLNGLVVEKGKRYGVATPANQSVYALVKMLERNNS